MLERVNQRRRDLARDGGKALGAGGVQGVYNPALIRALTRPLTGLGFDHAPRLWQIQERPPVLTKREHRTSGSGTPLP